MDDVKLRWHWPHDPWNYCDLATSKQAEQLIIDYLEAAQRRAQFWQQKFPHEDVEPLVMQALYLAAYSFKYKESCNTADQFYFWFCRKVGGHISNLVHKRNRWRKRHHAVVPFDPDLVDARYYYCMGE